VQDDAMKRAKLAAFKAAFTAWHDAVPAEFMDQHIEYCAARWHKLHTVLLQAHRRLCGAHANKSERP
jgi:hypothetical protein